MPVGLKFLFVPPRMEKLFKNSIDLRKYPKLTEDWICPLDPSLSTPHIIQDLVHKGSKKKNVTQFLKGMLSSLWIILVLFFKDFI